VPLDNLGALGTSLVLETPSTDRPRCQNLLHSQKGNGQQRSL